MGEYTGGAQRWNKAITEIKALEADDCDIDTAIAWMDENNRPIVGPWSLVTPIMIAKGQRDRGIGNKSNGTRKGHMRGMEGLV